MEADAYAASEAGLLVEEVGLELHAKGTNSAGELREHTILTSSCLALYELQLFDSTIGTALSIPDALIFDTIR